MAVATTGESHNLHPYFGKKERGMEPIRQWLYRFEFSTSQQLSDILVEPLSLNAQDVTIPGIDFTPITISHINQDVKYPGRPTVGTISVTFYTNYTTTYDPMVILDKWANKIYDQKSEAFGFADTYKTMADFLILKPDFSVYRTYVLDGIFPQTIPDLAMGWTQTSNVTTAITFSVDKIYLKDS